MMDIKEIVALISAWALGILTVNLTNDKESIANCRSTLLELENKLEELANRQAIPSRQPNVDSTLTTEIKQILKRLDIYHANLCIKVPPLKDRIDQSVDYLQSAKENRDSSENSNSSVGVHLRNFWGEGFGHDYKATKIKEMRNLLDKGLIKRTLDRMNSIPLTWSNILLFCIAVITFIFICSTLLRPEPEKLIISLIFFYN